MIHRVLLTITPALILLGTLPVRGQTSTRSRADWRSASARSQPSGASYLPNSAGQVWREYDLRPYSDNVRDVAAPEHAVLDWILRETGTDVWFGEQVGMLSVSRDAVRVYHTPEIQRRVARIVDQLLATEAATYVMHLRLVSLHNPNWRSRALRLMQPVPVQSTGV